MACWQSDNACVQTVRPVGSDLSQERADAGSLLSLIVAQRRWATGKLEVLMTVKWHSLINNSGDWVISYSFAELNFKTVDNIIIIRIC